MRSTGEGVHVWKQRSRNSVLLVFFFMNILITSFVLSNIQGGPTGFNTINWTITYVVWEMKDRKIYQTPYKIFQIPELTSVGPPCKSESKYHWFKNISKRGRHLLDKIHEGMSYSWQYRWPKKFVLGCVNLPPRSEQTYNLCSAIAAYSENSVFPVCGSFHFKPVFICVTVKMQTKTGLKWKEPHTGKTEWSE